LRSSFHTVEIKKWGAESMTISRCRCVDKTWRLCPTTPQVHTFQKERRLTFALQQCAWTTLPIDGLLLVLPGALWFRPSAHGLTFVAMREKSKPESGHRRSITDKCCSALKSFPVAWAKDLSAINDNNTEQHQSATAANMALIEYIVQRWLPFNTKLSSQTKYSNRNLLVFHNRWREEPINRFDGYHRKAAAEATPFPEFEVHAQKRWKSTYVLPSATPNVT